MKILSALLPLFTTLGLAAADAPAADAPAADAYPLKTCVVSGEALGSMGDAVSVVHEGTTVKFCCKGCIKKFNKDPAAYTAKVKEAAAKPAEAAAPAKPAAGHDHGDHKH